MTNGSTAKEIKLLLSEKGAIKTSTAQRLTLEIMTQIYEKVEYIDGDMKRLEEKIQKVENASIVLWVQKNPKTSLFLFTLYILYSVDIQQYILKALGI